MSHPYTFEQTENHYTTGIESTYRVTLDAEAVDPPVTIKLAISPIQTYDNGIRYRSILVSPMGEILAPEQIVNLDDIPAVIHHAVGEFVRRRNGADIPPYKPDGN